MAHERREIPGVTDPVDIAGVARPAFSTATVGGLANYWGQQFVRYTDADPWPRALFDRYHDYQAACAAIEAAFHLDETAGPIPAKSGGIGAYRAGVPRLLVGTRHDPTAGSWSMRRVVEQQLERHRATIVTARVETVAPAGAAPGTEAIAGSNLWEAKLSDGSAVLARRIILAAGVLGTASLLMRSFPDIRSARLRDHTPVLLHTNGIERIISTTRHGPDRHFNVQTLQRDTDKGAMLFATVYNMRYAPLNLVLLTLLNRVIPGLAGVRAPWPANWIKPVQVWTDSMTATVEIGRDGAAARVIDRPVIGRDAELAAFIATLRSHGVRVLRTSETPPLHGFHYYGLEILAGDDGYVPVTRYLDQRGPGQVHCVDASVLSDIGCQPHTETAMATALKLVSELDRTAA